MGFRTIVITRQCKCTFKNDYLVLRSDRMQMIHLSEIDMIILDTTAVSVTGYLINELAKWNIGLVFCDEHHNPSAQLSSIYGNYKTSRRIADQINWSKESKEAMWTRIIFEKIKNQSLLLKKHNKQQFELLDLYLSELELNDRSNREGLSAKVYFNALFGKDFNRREDNDINASLNYGYALILSAVNKEIIANGYITQIGIKHRNDFNDFNLSSDIMEPFRPLIDEIVYNSLPVVFDSEMRTKLLNIFNSTVTIDSNEYYLSSAISKFVSDVLKNLGNGTSEKVEFIRIQ